MRIERHELEDSLLQFVAAGSGLVVGAPGAGKTFALQRLSEHLIERGQVVLAVPVDQLGDAEEMDVRALLGYRSATFVEALQHEVVPLASHGVVVVDGFDAARNVVVRKNVMRLIRTTLSSLPETWRLVVSVRVYDAEHATELLQLFSADVDASRDTFRDRHLNARNFCIPPLSQREVEVACAELPPLKDLLADPRTSHEFRELVRLPFNIWLVERLLGEDSAGSELGSIVSEVELLGRYWDRYVRRPSDGFFRVELVRAMVDRCIERRRLDCDLLDLPGGGEGSSALRNLLSAELLQESKGNSERIGFAHNILFDYAVASSLAGDTVSELIEFLRDDPARPLFLRSALNYFFAQLWLTDRTEFWAMFAPLIDNEALAVRLVGRLVVPTVVVRMAQSPSEFESVFAIPRRDDRDRAILRLLQAARFNGKVLSRLWWNFGHGAAQVLSEPFAYELGGFISAAAEQVGDDVKSLEELSEFARTLFARAWKLRSEDATHRGWYDRFIAVRVLPVYLRTARFAPTEAHENIRALLGILDEPNFEIRILYALADQLGQWCGVAPDLAKALYRRAFAHAETSREPTEIGGVVIRLVGNRRQDFELVHHVLGRKYADLLASDLLGATVTAVEILDQATIESNVRPYLRDGSTLEENVEHFTFLNERRTLISDSSFMYWGMAHRRDEITEMVKHAIKELARDTRLLPLDVVTAIAARARTSVSWRVLLELGALAPERYAGVVFPLILQPELLSDASVLSGIRKFVAASSSHWTEENVRAIEHQFVLAERSGESGHGVIAATEDRSLRALSTLLLRVPVARLSPEVAQRVEIARSRATEGAGVIEEDENRSFVSFREVTKEEELSNRGVNLEVYENRTLSTLTEELEAIRKPFVNEVPNDDDASKLEIHIRRVWSFLRTNALDAPSMREHGRAVEGGSLGAPHPALIYQAWTSLSSSAASLARTRPSESSERFSLVREILLLAADAGVRAVGPDEDVSYSWASWSPSPRTEAIIGMAYLADRNGNEQGAPEFIARVSEFTASPAPEERFLAVRYSAVFSRSWPQAYQNMLLQCADREVNDVVLGAILDGFWRASRGARTFEERADTALRRIAESRAETRVEDLRAEIALWITYLAVERDSSWATLCIERFVVEGTALEKEKGRSLGEEIQRRLLLYASPNAEVVHAGSEGGKRARELLKRARDLTIRIVDASGDDARAAQVRLRERYVGTRAPNDDSDLVRLLARHSLVDSVAWILWQSAEKGWTSEQFDASKPLLDAVLRFAAADKAGSLSAPTTHRFVELLARVVELQPSVVVGYVRRFVEAAAVEGYQLDTLALQEIAPIVQRLLSDHRESVSDGEPLNDLLRLLDVFAEQGWTEALDLVWRLEEIYR